MPPSPFCPTNATTAPSGERTAAAPDGVAQRDVRAELALRRSGTAAATVRHGTHSTSTRATRRARRPRPTAPRAPGRRGVRGAAPAIRPTAPDSRSSISSRASPMACNRRVRILRQAAAQQPPKIGGRCRGQRGPVGSSFENRRDRDRMTVSPRNARRPVSISYSTQPNAQMSVALVDRRARAPAPGSCTRRAQDDAVARVTRPSRSATVPDHRSGAVARDCLGQAEVEHLHDAVGRDLDVCRLQVPMDDPSRVRRLQRIGDLPGDRERFRRAGSDPAPVDPPTSALRPVRGSMRGTPSDCSTP